MKCVPRNWRQVGARHLQDSQTRMCGDRGQLVVGEGRNQTMAAGSIYMTEEPSFLLYKVQSPSRANRKERRAPGERGEPQQLHTPQRGG